MKCSKCNWMKPLFDSEGRMIDFCVNTESGAYLSIVGVCGGCSLEDPDEKNAENEDADE